MSTLVSARPDRTYAKDLPSAARETCEGFHQALLNDFSRMVILRRANPLARLAGLDMAWVDVSDRTLNVPILNVQNVDMGVCSKEAERIGVAIVVVNGQWVLSVAYESLGGGGGGFGFLTVLFLALVVLVAAALWRPEEAKAAVRWLVARAVNQFRVRP